MATKRFPITDEASWLKWRVEDVTASEIGAIFGESPYQSYLEMYHAKRAGGVDIADNSVMQRGRWLEPAIMAGFAEIKPEWEVSKAGFYIRDPDLRIGATPDFLNVNAEPIEGKCPTWNKFDTEWNEGPPLHFQLQALTQAMLLDAPRGWVAALVVGSHSVDLHVWEVERNAAAEKRLKDGVAEFWRRMAEDDPPPPDYSRDKALIKSLYPKGGDDPIDLATHNRIEFLCEEMEAWRTRRRNAEGALDEVEAEIRDVLKDHDVGTHPRWKITNKLQKRKETVLEETEFRVLRITRNKEK